MIYYRSFRNQVIERLGELNWLMSDLAEELGVSPTRVSHVVSREDRLTMKTITNVAEALKIEPAYFDLYVARMLTELSRSAPGLIKIGRDLLGAKDTKSFTQKAAKLVA